MTFSMDLWQYQAPLEESIHREIALWTSHSGVAAVVAHSSGRHLILWSVHLL